eukprot:m.883060 g.883060  ORF g.883060 m.883060 type:complete len:254 (+) comp59880_c0_seq1:1-762(+)
MESKRRAAGSSSNLAVGGVEVLRSDVWTRFARNINSLVNNFTTSAVHSSADTRKPRASTTASGGSEALADPGFNAHFIEDHNDALNQLIKTFGVKDCISASKVEFTKYSIIFRRFLHQAKGEELAMKIELIWTGFYQVLLPRLTAIFLPLQLASSSHASEQVSIRKELLRHFRDSFLFNTIKETPEVQPALGRNLHMLLILEGLRLRDDNERHLQKMISQHIPFLMPALAPAADEASEAAAVLSEDVGEVESL